MVVGERGIALHDTASLCGYGFCLAVSLVRSGSGTDVIRTVRLGRSSLRQTRNIDTVIVWERNWI